MTCIIFKLTIGVKVISFTEYQLVDFVNGNETLLGFVIKHKGKLSVIFSALTAG